MYEVKVIEEFGEKRIYGFVNNQEIIAIGLHRNRKHTVMMSSCLPVDVNKALEYVNCMKETFTQYQLILKKQIENEL